MERKIHFKRLYALFLIPAAVLLSYLSEINPSYTERYYSSGIGKLIGQILSIITGIFPFSVAELVVIVALLLILYEIIYIAFMAIKRSRYFKYLLANKIISLLVVISIAYFLFIILWGINYHRLPFSDISGLKVTASSVEDLKQLCIDLIDKTNTARSNVKENSEGVMTTEKSLRQLKDTAQAGYTDAARLYHELSGRYGHAKGVLFSNFMSYSGINGIYFPFTGEANVNVIEPDSTLPSTICHEMAHQRGFAREDEANYISYLTCTHNPDPDFQYSGYLLALMNSLNAFYSQNQESYSQLLQLCSDGVIRDLKYISEFWKKYEGPVEEAQNKLNNAYLKSNMQADGVQSYGRMVDLLIAEYKAKHK